MLNSTNSSKTTLLGIHRIKIGENYLLNYTPKVDEAKVSIDDSSKRNFHVNEEAAKFRFKSYKPMVKKYLTYQPKRVIKRDMKICP